MTKRKITLQAGLPKWIANISAKYEHEFKVQAKELEVVDKKELIRVIGGLIFKVNFTLDLLDNMARVLGKRKGLFALEDVDFLVPNEKDIKSNFEEARQEIQKITKRKK